MKKKESKKENINIHITCIDLIVVTGGPLKKNKNDRKLKKKKN